MVALTATILFACVTTIQQVIRIGHFVTGGFAVKVIRLGNSPMERRHALCGICVARDGVVVVVGGFVVGEPQFASRCVCGYPSFFMRCEWLASLSSSCLSGVSGEPLRRRRACLHLGLGGVLWTERDQRPG